MQAALSSVMDGAITRAAEFVVDFSPVLFVVAGIALAMWVIGWTINMFGEGN